MNIEEFSLLYDEWRHLKEWSIGPVIRADLKKDPTRFAELTDILSTNCAPQPVAGSNSHFQVESSWHASFALECLNSEIVTSGGNLLFRGQSNATWPITPSIDRHDPTASQSRRMIETLAFQELLANLHTDLIFSGKTFPQSGFHLILPREAYTPVAQHYGFRTELVDFTADPSVAVFFASNSDFAQPGQIARVCVTRLIPENKTFENFHLKLVPPFFRRPYLQKGVFLKSEEKGDLEEAYLPDFIIDFPIKLSSRSFDIIRGERIDILPHDENIEIIRSLAEDSFFTFAEKNGIGTYTGMELLNFATAYAKENDSKIATLYKNELHKGMGYFTGFIEELEELVLRRFEWVRA